MKGMKELYLQIKWNKKWIQKCQIRTPLAKKIKRQKKLYCRAATKKVLYWWINWSKKTGVYWRKNGLYWHTKYHQRKISTIRTLLTDKKNYITWRGTYGTILTSKMKLRSKRDSTDEEIGLNLEKGLYLRAKLIREKKVYW